MRVWILTVTGKRFNLDVDPDYSIEKLKMLIQDHEGIPPWRQLLKSVTFCGEPAYKLSLDLNAMPPPELSEMGRQLAVWASSGSSEFLPNLYQAACRRNPQWQGGMR